MPLRTRLLLSLIVLALVPLILSGTTAFLISTNTLYSVERDDLERAVDSVNRALADLQRGLRRTSLDYANWDDLHQGVADEKFDPEWLELNFGSGSTSLPNIHSLNIIGLWARDNKLLYNFGPAEVLGAALKDPIRQLAGEGGDPRSFLLSSNGAIYNVVLAPIQTYEAKDPNGTFGMARQLGESDVQQIRELTGFDVALYTGERLIATTQRATLTPVPELLKSAAGGQRVFDVNDQENALAFEPVKNETGQTVATIVIWRSRAAITSARANIGLALVAWVVVSMALAAVVAILLSNSVARPLIAMAASADKMAAGDLSQRVVSPGARDELWRLADAFNRMAARVGARVTESETEKARLKSLDEFRLNLLTAISQSFYSSVNQIKNHSETLGLQVYGALNDPQTRSVGAIRRAVTLQAALLDDVLDFASAQQNRLRLSRERLELEPIVREVAEVIRLDYEQKNIQFVADIPDNLPAIFADRTRMEQVLERLLSWAFRLSAPGGQVHIEARAQVGNVLVTISDASTGLSPQDQERIFELFFQPEGETERGAASGLGLAFVKELVERQGGQIRIQTQPGKGNSFVFSVPATS